MRLNYPARLFWIISSFCGRHYLLSITFTSNEVDTGGTIQLFKYLQSLSLHAVIVSHPLDCHFHFCYTVAVNAWLDMRMYERRSSNLFRRVMIPSSLDGRWPLPICRLTMLGRFCWPNKRTSRPRGRPRQHMKRNRRGCVFERRWRRKKRPRPT